MTESEERGASGKAAKTVMVVDHEVIIRLSIADYLRECGFRVIEAASADEGMTVLEAATVAIDIILCDVDAPGSRNGFALAQWVRAQRPKISVILVGTPSSTANAAGDLCDNGPMLAKPYDVQLLLDRIRRLLG